MFQTTPEQWSITNTPTDHSQQSGDIHSLWNCVFGVHVHESEAALDHEGLYAVLGAEYLNKFLRIRFRHCGTPQTFENK